MVWGVVVGDAGVGGRERERERREPVVELVIYTLPTYPPTYPFVTPPPPFFFPPSFSPIAHAHTNTRSRPRQTRALPTSQCVTASPPTAPQATHTRGGGRRANGDGPQCRKATRPGGAPAPGLVPLAPSALACVCVCVSEVSAGPAAVSRPTKPGGVMASGFRARSGRGWRGQ